MSFPKQAYFLKENEELPWPLWKIPLFKCASSPASAGGGFPGSLLLEPCGAE